MPELPEMETYRRLLDERMAGRRVESAAVHQDGVLNVPPPAFKQAVTGAVVQNIERRAKHLLFWLDSGHVLLLHLMLGGWMELLPPDGQPRHASQAILDIGRERLHFHGLRYGYLHLHTPKSVAEKLAKLGPEPFDPHFTEGEFCERLAKKRGLLKAVLVDQHVLAGIGNCYSDELCFAAGIRPDRRLADMTREELARLYRAMHEVLHEAIRFGGYMESPLFAGDGLTGGYNDHCLVYDRGKEPCRRCGTPVVRTEWSSGRKMFYCEGCQR